ncbi:glycoprotein 3-alpha-L-fucosyltransferase [Marine Group I thaumarchaeote SCGC AAA799-E16]|uniref:Capsular polysaccharide biosynthesis glycosyltransferase CapM protein n=2 Tax=Marine Group I TaxID=905826 RepID=A0A087S3E7_9ARCH|nr:glycoprotein 3-alpha-L-fucosyltransferase [Marine Group I thaumarchaeote SCGC AAA799-E16]KFM20251.1 Capsular polysaccharide biosynthesis glycosyltransferase CapM protein [Marine Group I thaumarchaeote SCGC RSA3]
MRLLIGGSPSKFFHLKEFVKSLEKNGVECMLVNDSEFSDGFPGRKLSKWLSSNKKFTKLIEDFKPDVIFVDRLRHFALNASKTKIPMIIHLRGNYWKEVEMAKKTLYKSFPKNIVIKKWKSMGDECFQNSEIILPICNHLEKITKEHFPTKKVATLYSGINSDRWYYSPGKKLKHPCVGLLQGAVIWEKAKEMLVLKKVLEKLPNVTFYWVGDGPFRKEIISELGKYQNFVWLGHLDYPDKVREYLSEIDLYALISGIDMSPLTLQEAQLMEKPVIATNVGGIPELMKENETGFLVEKGNADQIIEKISMILENKVNSKDMGKKGKMFVTENFSWDKIAKDFIKICKEFL